jgi:hypothetical protein
VDSTRTSLSFDERGGDPSALYGRTGGTFTFDTTTNQLLSFAVSPGYPTVDPLTPQVLALFAAAGPCDLACFIGAVNGTTFTTSSPGRLVSTVFDFGAPLNGTAGVGTAQGPSRGFSLQGILRVTNAVPEPGTWAMMLLGFGAIGWAVRRQRVTQALASV